MKTRSVCTGILFLALGVSTGAPLHGQVVVDTDYKRPAHAEESMNTLPLLSRSEGVIPVYETTDPTHMLGVGEHIILADDVMLANPGETDITRVALFTDVTSFSENPEEITLWIFADMNQPAIHTQTIGGQEYYYGYLLADLTEPVRVPRHFYVGFSFQGNQDTDHLGVSQTVVTGQPATESVFYYGFVPDSQLTQTWVSPSPWAHKQFAMHVYTDTVDTLLPHFDIDIERGQIPLTVQFTDFSASSTADTVTRWEWDLDGDGFTDSNERNPLFTYQEPGIYDVTLTVSNSDGSESRTRAGLIHAIGEHACLDYNGFLSYYRGASFAGCDSASNVTAAFTVEAWINPTGYGTAMYPNGIDHSGYGKILSFGESTALDIYLHHSAPYGYAFYSLCVRFGLTASPVWYIPGSENIQNTPENSIVLNRWQHIAVTYDTSGSDCRIYIDGVEQELTSHADSLNGPIYDHMDDNILVGDGTDSDRPFEGRIDELRIWNRARTPEEINRDMHQMVEPGTPELASYWAMNEGKGVACFNQGLSGMILWNPFQRWTVGVPLAPPSSVEEREASIPERFMLKPNYPNPFNPQTTLVYSLDRAGYVSLTIYDILGREIVQLIHEHQTPGLYQVIWDGRDARQDPAASGIYTARIFFRTEHGELKSTSRKMLLLK